MTSRRLPAPAALLLALAACAHAGGSPAAGSEARARAPDPGASPPEVKPAPAPAYVTVTGSRIPQRVDPETGLVITESPVRVFDQDELRRTGHPEVGAALRSLDPAARVPGP